MKNSIEKVFVAASILLLLAGSGCGCGGEDDGRECGVSGDCREGQVCLDGRCEFLGECMTDSHCPQGSACIQGICVVRATVDCSSDSQCQPPSTVCVGERCVAGCSTTGCAPGERCDSVTGRCVAGAGGCRSDADCNSPSTVCSTSGECVAGCGTAGCFSGWVCNETTGRCVEGSTGCTSDAQCNPPSTICSAGGDCVAGCLTAGCLSGWVCNEVTGRCVEGPAACSSDAECNPPVTICDAGTGDCVDGCGTTGCAAGQTCDTGTGRCVEGAAECRLDSDCDPPSTICDAGAETCVSGCPTTGCPDGWECDSITGRCAEEVSSCQFDFDCHPPDTVCDPIDELCVPGCISTGCPGGHSCNVSTGHCEQDGECFVDDDCDPGWICEGSDCVEGCRIDDDCPEGEICDDGSCVGNCLEEPCPSPYLCDPYLGVCEPPGTVGMGGSCTDQLGEPDHKLCASDYCFPASETCTMPCTASMQCTTSGWQCLHVMPMGARACGYSDGTGTDPPGTLGCDNCKAPWCWDDRCTDNCQHDRDCPQTGYVCRVLYGPYGPSGQNIDMPTCATPTSGTGSTGQPCTNDSQCRRELCLDYGGGQGRCADPCHTSFDCPAGYVCTLVNGSGGSAVRLCLDAGTPTGSEGTGTFCDPATDLPCRSLLCAPITEEGDIGVCIDTCATHADCGSGMRCEIIAIDTTGNGTPDQTVPVCLFR